MASEVTFIRCLFGDGVPDRKLYDACLADVARSVTEDYKPEPMRYHVWGDVNYQHLISLGYPAQAIVYESTKPVVNYTHATERLPNETGEINWGMSIWRQKLVALQHSILLNGPTVMLDWDTRLTQPLPADFAERLLQGHPFQASLVRTKHAYCNWRAVGGNYRPHGSWVYCRDDKIIRDMLYLQETCNAYTEETIFAYWWDAMSGYGPWNEESPDVWKESGFEPYCHRHRLQAFPPEIPLFEHVRG